MRASTVGLRFGRYEVGERLGKGGFGVVHVARDVELGREVAIKFLRPELMARTQVVQRFLQEARACAKIGHPGIVTVFECGVVEGTGERVDGTAFIVMERLRGESLGARVASRGKLPPIGAIGIARQLAAALQLAHDAGIIHRDLKPDNVYLVKDAAVVGGERVKILDFGVAKLREPDPEENPHTHSQMMLGTPRYMSPEQARAAAKVDHRTDIYALGCLLYELVCGKPPFVGDIGDVLVAHQTQPITPPREIVASIPPALDELIVRMLAKDPNARPQTMRLVDQALDGVFASLAPKQRAKTAPDEEQTTPHVQAEIGQIGPSTDEPTFRFRPSDHDTTQDLEDYRTTRPTKLPPRAIPSQTSFEPTEPMRGPASVPWRWRLALGAGAALLAALVMYLILRKPARELAVVLPDAAPTAGPPRSIAAECAASQRDKRWAQLEACGHELAKSSPAEGAELVRRATREARAEVKFRGLEEALRTDDLRLAGELIAELPEDSVYAEPARAAYNVVKHPLADRLVAELDAITDCTVHGAKLRVAETRYGAKLAQEVRLTARPCTRTQPVEAKPAPVDCEHTTDDERRGDTAVTANDFTTAVEAFDKVAKCRPQVLGKLYLAACRAHQFPKAKRAYDTLGRSNLAPLCLKEGFDPR